MLPFHPKLRGAALFTWVIGLAALVVGLSIWSFAYDQHRMFILPLGTAPGLVDTRGLQ